MLLNLAWADFKQRLDAGTPFRYISTTDAYYLVAGMDLIELNCVIVKNSGAAQTEFEASYQSTAVTYSLSPLSPGSYANITGNTTSTVKSGSGVLMGVCINDNSVDGTITLYDNTAGSGTKIATIHTGTPSGGLLSSSGVPGPASYTALNVKFTTGLTVVTSGSTSNNITIIYR